MSNFMSAANAETLFSEIGAKKISSSSIAGVFSSTASYEVGDLLIFRGDLYKCTKVHSGTWSDDDFVKTTVEDEFKPVEMTWAAYQALSDDEKNDGTVRYITDYPSSGGGLPDGGTEGQILIKNSDVDGDATWQSIDSAPTLNSTKPISSGGVYTEINKKEDKLIFDNSPTENSSNPVKSGGIYTEINKKQDKLTFDTVPTSGSTNPVTSGGVYTEINKKQDKLTFDSTPTASSTNPVTSGGIKSALDQKQGTLSFDSTPTSGSNNPVTSAGIKTAIDLKASITVTTTDPGEGSTLSNNTLLVVVEG